MGFEPPPSAASEPPLVEPAEDSARSDDTALFVTLLLLSIVAAAAGYPYMRAFAEQDVGSSFLSRQPVGAGIVILILGHLVLVGPSVSLGLRLGPGLGLDLPFLRAWVARVSAPRPFAPVLRLAAFTGFGLGAVLTAMNLLPFLDFEEKLRLAGRPIPEHPPVLAGVLGSFSAGVIEELMLRFGLMTLLAWLIARVGRGTPVLAIHVANVVAALAFGALHFANAEAIGLPLDATVVGFVLALNGLVGVACGWLYWKHGLEAAMICHVAVDLVIHGLVPALSPAA